MKYRRLLILMSAVAVLGAGGAAAYFALSPVKRATNLMPPTEEPGIVSMETFMANINDPAGERYAKVTLRLTVSPAAVADVIGQDQVLQARMRDRVLTLLTSKSYQDLLSPLGKESFRRELKTHLGPLLEVGQIEDVLFSDFVVQ